MHDLFDQDVGEMIEVDALLGTPVNAKEHYTRLYTSNNTVASVVINTS